MIIENLVKSVEKPEDVKWDEVPEKDIQQVVRDYNLNRVTEKEMRIVELADDLSKKWENVLQEAHEKRLEQARSDLAAMNARYLNTVP